MEGALPEIVHEGRDNLRFVESLRGLAQSLRDCLNNAKLRSELGEKGLARAKQFSWQTSADLVWKNFNEL